LGGSGAKFEFASPGWDGTITSGGGFEGTAILVEAMMRFILCTVTALSILIPSLANSQESKYYAVPKGDFPHDVAVGPGGEVWYSGQKRGVAGRLDPVSGQIERIPLGGNSAPHGVIVGPDGAPCHRRGAERHRAR
jgi:streptogramin lyase